jgi:hypothetical protein
VDDSLRRRLRFSLVLQIMGALMMGVAAGVRISSVGLDALSAVFLVAALLIAGVAVVTATTLRRTARDPAP